MNNDEELLEESKNLANSILTAIANFNEQSDVSPEDKVNCILNALANCAGRAIAFMGEDLPKSLHYTDLFLKNVRGSLPVHLEAWEKLKEDKKESA
jgi:hypothetical protein